jgi:hypothetical protein
MEPGTDFGWCRASSCLRGGAKPRSSRTHVTHAASGARHRFRGSHFTPERCPACQAVSCPVRRAHQGAYRGSIVPQCLGR